VHVGLKPAAKIEIKYINKCHIHTALCRYTILLAFISTPVAADVSE
jgi:hypothetical protein